MDLTIKCITMWLVVMMSACGGDSTTKPIKPVPIDNIYEDIEEVNEEDAFQGEEAYDSNVPVLYKYEIIILHDTSKPLNIPVGGAFNVMAKVIDYENPAKPPENYTVFFAIESIQDLGGQEAQGDGQFAMEMVSTNINGIVQNPFSAGLIGGRAYLVSLAGDYAEKKTFIIVVSEAPCGCVDVKMKYDGALPASSLNTIKVYVLPNQFTCDKLFPEKPVPPSIGNKTMTDIYGNVQFECIPSDTYYTVFATALGPGKCVAAYGCDDGVFVQEKKCREVVLDMDLAQLVPTGMYDCTDHYDFTNVIKDCANGVVDPLECVAGSGDAGQKLCCALYQIITFFKTPGTTIIALIKDLAKQFLGSLIVDAVFGLFGDAVAKIITDYLKNSAPKWVKDFFTIGEDMMGIITNLELLSDLNISKLQGTSVQGTHYWHSLVLYWKIGCDPSKPDYKECGKIVLGIKNQQGNNFPMDIIEGKFTAMVVDFNKLIINKHNIKLNYGKLILWVLNQLIIPKITQGKAHSVKEAAQLWINCPKIADGIFGEIVSWFTGDKKDLENVCIKAVDFLFGFVDPFLNALAFNSEISLQGNAVLVDKDCDLKTDLITEGKYQGLIEMTSGQPTAFTGTFEAVRKK